MAPPRRPQPPRDVYRLAVLALFLAVPARAAAQQPAPAQPAQPAPSPGPRADATPSALPAAEEILGYDPGRGVLAYVERAPSELAGFAHVTLVELPRDNGPVQRIRLTTDVDVAQVRGASAANREATRRAIDARVARDVAAARARFEQAPVLPVFARGATPSGCQRAPFAPREFTLGADIVARVVVDPGDAHASITLTARGRTGAATDVTAVALSSGATAVQAPYNLVADARELPGTDAMAVLLRTDACTPENVAVPVRAAFVTPPPPAETPLAALPNAEIQEAALVRAVAPGAQRRTVDGVAGYYDGRDRVVYDTAWTLPPERGAPRILAQYARRSGDLSPLLAEAGEAPARFALLTRDGRGRLRVLSQHVPPAAENVVEGVGQQAFAADVDGDGLPEVVVRTRHSHDDEVATVLHTTGDAITFVWRVVTRLDERANPAGAQATVRRCDLGLEGHTLVSRCAIETYRAGAAADAPPVSRGRLVQRLRWNAGVVQLSEERH